MIFPSYVMFSSKVVASCTPTVFVSPPFNLPHTNHRRTASGPEAHHFRNATCVGRNFRENQLISTAIKHRIMIKLHKDSI